ncbi:MAG: hypothetical protein O3A43_01535 [Proteobacteria bacterium]|nr:hypothetical protein [Pseudomonadota bacterium]MDA1082959.1 hypothetical protein [Pseudomonadota bacterium]
MKIFKNIFLFCLIFSLNIESYEEVRNEILFSEKPPLRLSEYGFFTNMNSQLPSKGVLPYTLKSQLFSDYADKLRFIYIPKNKFALNVPDKVFDFPDGTALIKTFAYLNQHTGSNLPSQLLETRLLIKKNGEWSNISYIWNKDQNEAFLSIAGKTITTKFINSNGELKDVRYRVPNINQCKECHQVNKTITPIGPKARNLNTAYAYNDGSMNQIEKWHKLGWIDSEYPIKSMVDWADQSANLDDRARSYLDINCGHCHIEGGSADTSGLYLNFNESRKINLGVYKKPVATGRASNNLKYSIVPGNPEESILLYRMQSLDPGIMMPESGRALEHSEAIQLVSKWIKNL